MATCNLPNPLLWQSLTFGDRDAFTDFTGVLMLWHRELARVTKTVWYPLDDLRSNLTPLATMHDHEADALGIPRADDLVSYDLRDKDSFAGWAQTISLDLARLRTAAGL